MQATLFPLLGHGKVFQRLRCGPHAQGRVPLQEDGRVPQEGPQARVQEGRGGAPRGHLQPGGLWSQRQHELVLAGRREPSVRELAVPVVKIKYQYMPPSHFDPADQ